jgi:hypothetical protein
MNTIKYNSPKWFNLDTAKLLDNHNPYNKINFPKKDNNIKVELYKTDIKPKFIIIPKKEKTLEEEIIKLSKYLKDNLKKCKKESNEKTLITKVINKSNQFNTVIRSKIIYLDLNNNQKLIIKEWINNCKNLYNICIDKHNTDPKYFNKGYKAIKKNLFNSIYGKIKKDTPYDVLTDEVRVFCSNLKSCYTNIANKNITHFKLTKKLKQKTNYSLLIPSKSINNKGLFITKLGEINNFKLNNLPIHDCRLYYNSHNDTYSLNIPTDIRCKKIPNRESISALDPGEKKFMTLYGSQSNGYIGNDIRKPLLKIRDKIKKYQKVLSKGLNKSGDFIKNTKQLQSKIRKLYNKSRNIVKEQLMKKI